MKSLRRVFEKIKKDNRYWSDYMCFAETVHGRGFTKRTIQRHFNALIDKEDYSKSEKKEILKFLVELSKSG
jgi:hypothetical protein